MNYQTYKRKKMDIISRHCINKNILIYEHDFRTQEFLRTYTDKEFGELIDRWKLILIEKYKVQPGQTLSGNCGPNVFYYALLFACAELGLTWITDWPRVYNAIDLENPILAAFGKIDFIVKSRHEQDPADPAHNPWEAKRDNMYGNTIIFEDEFHSYETQDTELFDSMATTIWATPETNLIYNCSSGTTGNPTTSRFNHKKVYCLAHRMGKVYPENDSFLHTMLIHHGACSAVHFLPGFIYGKEQFILPIAMWYDPKLIDMVLKYKINNLFLFHTDTLLTFLQNIPTVDHKLNIMTLYQITKQMIPYIKEKNINKIMSSFGDNIIGGSSFFIKLVDQQTDLETYNVTKFNPPFDDFFKFKIENRHLYVSCPTLSEDWKTSNDIFEIKDGYFYFLGRDKQYRINDEWINLEEIQAEVTLLFGDKNANIVIDPDMQKIYLAVWKNSPKAEAELNSWLEEKYKTVKISFVLKNKTYKEFFGARKIDHGKIRQFCRSILLNQGEDVK